MSKLTRAARAAVESLEPRQLLSAAPHPSHANAVAGATLSGGVVTVYGTKKADNIVLSEDTSAGTLTATVNGAATSFPADGITQVQVFPLNGNDYVSGGNITIPLYVKGGTGNQTLVGGAGGDTLIAGKGNDLLKAGTGTDNIVTGPGQNRVILGTGTATVNGKAGKNIIVKGTGTNNIQGDAKHNTTASEAVPLAVVNPSNAVPEQVFGTTTGLSVQQVRNAYDFGNLGDPNFTNRGAGQGVAVVIPYNTPLITQSLAAFSTTFGLPAPDAAHFQVVTVSGTVPPADPNPSHPWETEAATDVEWVHAIAPDAKIFLVLANSSAFPDLFSAVDKAVATLNASFGGGVVSMSFGSFGGELDPVSEAAFDNSFSRAQAQNVSFIAAAGDQGGVVSYPSISPFVTSVGGSSLVVDSNGNRVAPEAAWTSGGGGVSTRYVSPPYQQGNISFPTNVAPGTMTPTPTVTTNLGAFRVSPDVAYDADPSTGMAVFDAQTFGDINTDGVPDSGWLPGGAGGTSIAAAQWAGLAALANQRREAGGRGFLGNGLNAAIYHAAETFGTEDFNDITTGRAGNNPATAGFDRATGWGTPIANNLITRLAQADISTVNNNMTWNAFYRLPIVQTGALAGPGEGFFVGHGTAVGGASGINLTFTPDANQPINYTATSTAGSYGGSGSGSSGTTASTYTSPYAALIGLTINTLTRNDVTGKLSGTGRATILTTVSTPVFVPPPSGGGGTPPTTGGGANTGGNPSGSGYGNTTGTGSGTGSGYTTTTTGGLGSTAGTGAGSGTGQAGNNPFTTNTTSQLITVNLSVSGVSYRSASGKIHLRGSFVALDPLTGQPAQEGVAPQFQGKFSVDA